MFTLFSLYPLRQQRVAQNTLVLRVEGYKSHAGHGNSAHRFTGRVLFRPRLARFMQVYDAKVADHRSSTFFIAQPLVLSSHLLWNH